MFLDTDTRYTRDLETWVDNARNKAPGGVAPAATVLSLLAGAALVGMLIGGGAA